ncbi:efflux RND transporter periplasmic adaptor subunit [Marispirochaeta sp.]|uniref:HlyD family secretion protein n=1 Tax=Marispirochaeta sp. TaxID=2038653 RepID=UPI0029C6FE48|nr:HlyD family efflux transporter periplasmic adaptor subunit [Marispirochaeta sp.]
MNSIHISRYTRLTIFILLAGAFLSGCGKGNGEKIFTGLAEGRVYTVSSPVSDRLVELDVREGSRVEEGSRVGQIDTSALELQRKALVAKQDQVDLQLEELAINTAQVEDTRDYYRATYTRNLELLKEQAVSDQKVRDLKLNADKWERELAGLRLKKESLKRQRDEIGYRLEELDLTIAKGRLMSPAAGYVDQLFYETGEFVPALRIVARIVNLRQVWCYLYLGEEGIAEISPGQEMTARQGEHTFVARVEHINSRAEFSPKEVLTPENRAALVYAVRVGIENPDGILKIGMPVVLEW